MPLLRVKSIALPVEDVVEEVDAAREDREEAKRGKGMRKRGPDGSLLRKDQGREDDSRFHPLPRAKRTQKLEGWTPLHSFLSSRDAVLQHRLLSKR